MTRLRWTYATGWSWRISVTANVAARRWLTCANWRRKRQFAEARAQPVARCRYTTNYLSNPTYPGEMGM
ncbi:hypothetical protein KCP73_20310 [Salmonella enterica subsp. enterica]|nr:hypothetical protein KCP73_20310 [Salmonella enterica subsp. enterica]